MNDITYYFDEASEIIVTVKGESTTFNKGDEKYEAIILSLKNVTNGAHEMPAFGVSLDKETRKEMQDGTWIELVYNLPKKHNGMPFESLLISVNADYSGFNLIRKVNGKYDGRCFYLDLVNKNMSEISTTLQNLSLNK